MEKKKYDNNPFIVARLPLIRRSQPTDPCLSTTSEILNEFPILETKPDTESCENATKKELAIINTFNQLNDSCSQVPWEPSLCSS